MDWQPIETAPKDGTWVLVYGPDGIDKGQFQQWAYGTTWEREFTASYDNDLCEISNPTHWMPLPEPPQC